MRVFFAIEFNNELKSYIKNIQNIIKDGTIKGNFSREENFHLTLRFIGEVNNDKVDSLKKSLDKVVRDFSPFTFRITEPGWFKRGDRRIIWLGIDKGDNALNALYDKLQLSLETIGYEKEERAYTPHITILRDALLVPGYEEKIKRLIAEPYIVNVNSISLMESTRVNGILTYLPAYKRELSK